MSVRMGRAILIAAQFLTILPVRFRRPPSDAEIGRSLTVYPLIGLLLGAGLAIGAWLLRRQAGFLTAALLLAAWTIVTGALHLDGLADCADAWVGGRGTRARTLAIMKDPASGPMGVTAIVIVLLLKFAGLTVLCRHHAYGGLAIAPVLARAAVQLLFLTTPYVRAGGLGAALAARMRRGELLFALLLTVAGVVLAAGLTGLWVLAGVTLVFFLARRSICARIGGATGDTAGAMVEIIEACVLLGFGLALGR